jgi:putative DNA primase/helicase
MSDTDAPKPHEIASALLQQYNLATMMDTSEVYVYDRGKYIPGADLFMTQQVEKDFDAIDLGGVSSNHFVAEVLGHLKRRTYVPRTSFDQDPHIFNLQNGLLDVDTFQLTPHRPDYRSLVQLPVAYDKTADCPSIRKFIREVLWPEDVNVIQEYVGCCLWKEPSVVQKAMLLFGEGSNGKTTLITLVKTLLGQQNIAARSLQDLELNRFARADLFGKLANLYPDLPASALKSVGIFKGLTGGDPFTVERKFQQPFTFTPYAKHIYSANVVPKVYEDTFAFFRRWIIITFPNTFTGNQDNKELLGQLTTPTEMSGFLNWTLEGLRRLRDNKWNFSYSKSVEQVKDSYIRASDPVKAFVMDCCIVDIGLFEVKRKLHEAFLEYCRDKKLPPYTDTRFYRDLPLSANVKSSQRTINARKGVHCFEGISLRQRENWGIQETLEHADS